MRLLIIVIKKNEVLIIFLFKFMWKTLTSTCNMFIRYVITRIECLVILQLDPNIKKIIIIKIEAELVIRNVVL